MLPFENLSDNKENAYFADGIQDDMLTNLSKIGDLKVISRTSVMQYRGRADQSFARLVRPSAFQMFSRAVCAARKQSPRERPVDRCEHRRAHWANDYDRELT